MLIPNQPAESADFESRTGKALQSLGLPENQVQKRIQTANGWVLHLWHVPNSYDTPLQKLIKPDTRQFSEDSEADDVLNVAEYQSLISQPSLEAAWTAIQKRWSKLLTPKS